MSLFVVSLPTSLLAMIPGLAYGLMGAIIFTFGAAIGSFLNVVVYRLPAGLSLVHPPSRCPHCHHRLSPWENVPVLGWVWLGGRCRQCRQPIAVRYPLVEAVTGLLFVLLVGVFGLTWTAVGYGVLVCWLMVLALIDLDTLTLPNVLTQSGVVLGLGFQVLRGVQSGELAAVAQQVMTGVGGMVLGVWLFGAIALVGSVVLGQTAMAGGDVKLAAMLGSWLGWKAVLLILLLSAFLGSVVGMGGRLLNRLQAGQPMPFGPFLVLGALITLFYETQILDAYLRFSGLSSGL